MKHLYLIGLFLSLSFFGFSQGEFNIWHFGNKAALNFNTGFPVSFGGSQLQHTGPSTSISDSLGNILFYSEGWNVYNRNNVVMPNGSINGGGCSINYDQMNLGVKQINNLQRYYLFTAGCYQPGPSNAILRYSVVDMTLGGGNGAVVAGMNGIPLPGGYRAYYSVTGTRHHNNRDAWVVVRLEDTDSNYYASYLVDPAGLSFVPVLSNSGIQMSTPPFMTLEVSNMRISKDGSKLVANYDSIAEVCQFNDATGQVSPLFHFYLPLIMGVPTDVNMVEFSLDSKLLYVSGRSRWAPVHGFLYQYDVTKTDSAQFVQSCVLLDSISGGMGHALQMAPDWKIYVSNPMINDTLSVINNPSVLGIGCNFQKGVVDVKSFDGGTGFPQFIERYYAVINDSGYCQNQPFHFTPAIWPPADSIHWDFGDPASGVNNISNIQNPFHTYHASGPFSVHLFVRHNDNRIDSTTKTILVAYAPQPLLGPDQIICNGDSITLDAGLFGGATYQWANLTLGQYNIGNGQTYKTNVPDTYMVSVTDYDGCTGMDTIRLYPPPHVTNDPLFKTICSGESTAIPLTSDVPGTNFHWTASLTSGTVTGFSADSGLFINQVLINPTASPGIVNYHITPKTGNCNGIPSDFSVTVNPIDTVKVSISASVNNICAGTSVTFTATPANPGLTPTYHWKVNGVNSGTNSTSFTYTPLNNDVVTCELTSSNTVCTFNNPATSNQVLMVVNSILVVSVSVSASANNICAGTSVTFTATPANGGLTPSYQWKVNGGNAGTNNPNYTYVPANGDLVTCTLTSSEPCTSGNPATSIQYPVSVNPNQPVSITISASSNPFCQGSTVTFTAVPTNGGSAPVYQWKVNGANAGINSSTLSYIPNNGDIVTCNVNSNVSCPTGNPASSNTITMVQNNSIPVSVSIASSSNPVCAGISVTFTAAPTNGGTTPSYQWKVNGSNAGTNSPVYTYVPANGDLVTCTLTSNVACAGGNPATSNSVTMTVNPNLPVSLSVSASANPVCAGTIVTFTAIPVNGGSSPSYQWYINSNPVGTNNLVCSYIPINGDLVSCTLTSSAICATNNPATSIQYPVTVNPNMPVSVTITASANPICSGVAVTFTASPTNGGSAPSYQWKVNGTNAGTNLSTYTYNPASGDQVQCIIASNIFCPTGNPAISNTITMIVASPPVVTLTSCFDTITMLIAKPIKLRGGIPLGGTYSGAGVNSLTNIFTPSLAGAGTHTITYTYTNASLCTAAKTRTITVLSTPAFTCGNILTDIRDGKSYSTVQIGTQCWFAEDLNYGIEIPDIQDQRDNCIPEKYHNPASSIQHPASAYQWDELMRYDDTPAQQGLCPPGWHVPTENEWNTLFSNWVNNAFAGAPLKYSGYSGFNALMTGALHLNIQWDYNGLGAFFWSSTAHGPYKAWAHAMNDFDPSVAFYPSARVNAFSVRCLKD